MESAAQKHRNSRPLSVSEEKKITALEAIRAHAVPTSIYDATTS